MLDRLFMGYIIAMLVVASSVAKADGFYINGYEASMLKIVDEYKIVDNRCMTFNDEDNDGIITINECYTWEDFVERSDEVK